MIRKFVNYLRNIFNPTKPIPDPKFKYSEAFKRKLRKKRNEKKGKY